jgi:hypothetical protein
LGHFKPSQDNISESIRSAWHGKSVGPTGWLEPAFSQFKTVLDALTVKLVLDSRNAFIQSFTDLDAQVTTALDAADPMGRDNKRSRWSR